MDHDKPSRLRRLSDGPAGMLIFGWGMGLATLGAVVLIIVLSLSLSGWGEWSFDEVARVSNVEANVDAVLVETNGGATTSFGYLVFVFPAGRMPKRDDGPVAGLYGAWRSKRAYGVNLRWEAKNALSIEYLDAQAASLRNAEVNIGGRPILIAMKSGISDANAPSGGMLYNLLGPKSRE